MIDTAHKYSSLTSPAIFISSFLANMTDTCATASVSSTDLLNGPIEPSEWEAFVATLDDFSQDEQNRPQQTERVYQEDVTMSLKTFGPFAPTTAAAAIALVPPSASTEHLQTNPSSTAQGTNDAAFMDPPPLTHSSKPPFTPINYGCSVSCFPPSGSKEEVRARPPTYDNVTIPPHLTDIIHRDVFDLAVKTSSVLVPPPAERDYKVLSAWYIAANSSSARYNGNCTTFLTHKAHYDSLALCAQQGFSSHGQIPAEVWFSNGVEPVAIDGSIAQHINVTNCSQCLIHAFRMVQDQTRREKGAAVRLQQDKFRTAHGGINGQARRRCKDNLKRKVPCEVSLGGSGPLVGGGELPSEYAKAFERWDDGMKRTLPGYAGSERRRAWYARRDQGVW